MVVVVVVVAAVVAAALLLGPAAMVIQCDMPPQAPLAPRPSPPSPLTLPHLLKLGLFGPLNHLIINVETHLVVEDVAPEAVLRRDPSRR